MNYSYNPRGWLRYTHSELFRQLLRYQDTASNRQYNGNISHQVFMRRGNTGSPPAWVSDTYNYRYDGAGRLIQGTIGSGRGGETLTYTKNGNISSLQRTDGSGTVVDRLRYDYGIWGNVLASVYDTLATTTGTDPFQLPALTNYAWDNNGNMLARANTNTAATHSRNNISGITYNT
ncbi:hypothetical protein [Parapedobacter sp. DT-150]|uniref:hypothetical protein n=1 Tax=Parapedobacter sp. DT-150 TaxID=3396162 RepID=UPI003F1DC3A2